MACFRANSPLERFAPCFLAAAIGYSSLYRYLAMTGGGAPAGLLIVVLLSLLWTLVVGLTTGLVRRSAHWSSVLAYPVAWASLDVLIATFSPHSTFGSLAYSQLAALPVTQVAAIGGTPAVVFLISLPASVAAFAVHRKGAISVAGYVVAALARMAVDNGVYVVAGVGIARGPNLAWLFGPTGTLEATYVKHHLVPGLEAEHVPGTEYTVRTIDGLSYGIAICKDMHFPSLGREYGRRGVDAMLVPAWDFGADGWITSRLTALRGVESGYPIVRSSREGKLTVTDSRGRVVADMASAPLPGVTLIADVPVGAAGPTPYVRFENWFGWLCVLALAGWLGARRLLR